MSDCLPRLLDDDEVARLRRWRERDSNRRSPKKMTSRWAMESATLRQASRRRSPGAERESS
jgi:hypothetical protein